MKEQEFEEVASIIKIARSNTIKNINRALIELYWNIGGYIQEKITSSQWGQSVVEDLGQYLNNRHPDLKGFSGSNLWRMRQFYSTYRSDEFLAPLVREIGWSQNLSIMSRCKTAEERAFYLKICLENQYSKRELDRQISTGLFERVMIGGLKLSPTIKATHPDAEKTFKDSYIFDFLNLSETYRESDLQRGLIAQMKDFILELGKDFLFFGEEYKLQVGNSDFYIDLLFYHRSLQCLVAFELKTDRFKPEHLGQLNFYLEALDRKVKKEHENPSIGILLCKDKDNEVVEYALNRSLSPTLVAQYKTSLPDKDLLQQKLSELFNENKE
ncbi:MAG: YhcG family protein [Bacteroidia bacterium]|jgi:predicted nuclease of restriction endonuclease-like (RecB) superfamily